MNKRISYFFALLFVLISCEENKTLFELENTSFTYTTDQLAEDVPRYRGMEADQLNAMLSRQIIPMYQRAMFFKDSTYDAFPYFAYKRFVERKYYRDYYRQHLMLDEVKRSEYAASYFRQNRLNVRIHHLNINSTYRSKPVPSKLGDKALADSLLNVLKRDPNEIQTLIKQFGVEGKTESNINLLVRWRMFPERLQNAIYDRAATPGLIPEVIQTDFGHHIVYINRTTPTPDFPYETEADFLDAIGKDNNRIVGDIVNAFSFRMRDRFVNNTSMVLNQKNVTQLLKQLDGLSKQDVAVYKYPDLSLATVQGAERTYAIKASDLHATLGQRFFGFLRNLSTKPYALGALLKRMIADIELKDYVKKNYPDAYTPDPQMVELRIATMKYDYYINREIAAIDIDSTMLRNFYEQNKLSFLRGPYRQSYGFSVNATDSAKLDSVYSMINPRTLLKYYKALNPLAARSGVDKKPRLGNLTEASLGAVSKAIFKAKPNELIPITRHNNRYYVGYYTTETPASLRPFDMVEHELKRQFQSRAEQMVSTRIDSMITKQFTPRLTSNTVTLK